MIMTDCVLENQWKKEIDRVHIPCQKSNYQFLSDQFR